MLGRSFGRPFLIIIMAMPLQVRYNINMNNKTETAKETLNMRMKLSDKQRWKKTAKENAIPMSQLIIRAVNKECERLEK